MEDFKKVGIVGSSCGSIYAHLVKAVPHGHFKANAYNYTRLCSFLEEGKAYPFHSGTKVDALIFDGWEVPKNAKLVDFFIDGSDMGLDLDGDIVRFVPVVIDDEIVKTRG